MAHRAHVVTNKEQADPYSGSSLVPMLVIGLVLTLIGVYGLMTNRPVPVRHIYR